jgi:magnesium chelatase family protein
MVAKTFGGAVHGVDARTILVEVSVDQGTKFFMSGLPDNAIKKVSIALNRRSKVRASLCPEKNRCEPRACRYPQGRAAYDLSIALSVLRASGQISR